MDGWNGKEQILTSHTLPSSSWLSSQTFGVSIPSCDHYSHQCLGQRGNRDTECKGLLGEGLWHEDPADLTFEASTAEGQSSRKQGIPPVSWHYPSKAVTRCFFLCED